LRLASSADLVQLHLVVELCRRLPTVFGPDDRRAVLAQLVSTATSAHQYAAAMTARTTSTAVRG